MFICVTNRKLCTDDFLARIRRIARAKPFAVILREKDMDQAAYEIMARQCQEVCEMEQVPLVIHSNLSVARCLGVRQIHLSMPLFLEQHNDLTDFDQIGVSVHSLEEALRAENMGAHYLIAGHIFATTCKPDLEPRGLSFIKAICSAVSIPVFGIGGLNRENIAEVRASGAAGGCLMSSLMTCDDIESTVTGFT